MAEPVQEEELRHVVKHIERIMVEEEKGYKTLLSHSMIVAGYARLIAESEGLNPDALFIAGLLHDLGKLTARNQGVDEVEYRNKVVMKLLDKLNLPQGLTETIRRALREPGSLEAAILHDADVLSKLGTLGIYTFASKWAVKARSILEALVEGLPRELAIAANIDHVLVTGTAKKIGKKLATRLLQLYTWLLDELHGLGFNVKLVEEKYNGAKLFWVVLTTCPRCEGVVGAEKKIHHGEFCEGLKLVHQCRRCGLTMESKICLQWINKTPN